MSKIKDLLYTIRSGARTNKYRIIYPNLPDLDIVCNATTNPGKELGTVDVFIKGRKFQYASENTDDGQWEFTIYNTSDLFHRLFFLKLLDSVHSFNEPEYMNDTNVPESQMSKNNITLGNSGSEISSWDISPRSNSKSSTRIKEYMNALKPTDLKGQTRPWYMQEIIIQQLDHNEEVVSSSVLHNAFINNVGQMDYTDETGEISTSTISVTYSGISYI